MTPRRASTSPHELQIGLLRAVIIAAIVAAIMIVAAIALGWTLPAAPSFDLTTNLGIDLP